ncbi:DUF1573 domain-containing protein [Filimonas effusa]|uniref:DUF1573 domain-containing protein n=1 Tax=Filimonas effusa TaxID=2508721 RepID=A0A4Q1D9I9_9BACT|nr:DUF1573 domain-containing protein [Filimonas effusa]RXK85890.1 DUF1573 domain-containing protein [Filimonas effusa]
MKYMALLLLVAAMAACNNNSTTKLKAEELSKVQADTARYTTIAWVDSIHQNIGTLTIGEKVEIKYRVKNTGQYPLILTNVVASCGCTVPSYTKEPIAPGAEGVITASFDSNRSPHPGEFRKTVGVTANTKPAAFTELVFSGLLKEAK